MKLLSCLLGKLSYYNIFFQSNDLNHHEVIKTLQECFILIGELIVQLPEMELTRKAQEKRFEDIYKVPFENKSECEKYVMTLPQFEIQFLKAHEHFSLLLANSQNEFKSKFFKTAKDFLIESITKMKECLPYHEKALFDSEVVFMQDYDEEKWMRLKNRFYNIIKQEEFDEFQEQMKRFKYNFSRSY